MSVCLNRTFWLVGWQIWSTLWIIPWSSTWGCIHFFPLVFSMHVFFSWGRFPVFLINFCFVCFVLFAALVGFSGFYLNVLFKCMFVLALGRFQVFVLPKSGSPTCVDIIFVGRTYEFRTSWISFAFPTLTQIFIISSFNVQHGTTRRESMDILTISLPKSYKPFPSFSKVVYLK